VPSATELEDAAARDAVAGLKARLEELTGRSLPLYEMMNEDARRTVAGLIANQLATLNTDDVAEPMRKAAMAALGQGARDAARRAGVPAPSYVNPSAELRRVWEEAPAKAREELEKAAAKVREARTPDDLQDALTGARRAVTRTEAAARFTVNRSLSEGTEHVADQHGLSRIWLPERDACVHCLAYAGEVAGPGESFRGGLTFGRKPLHAPSESVDGCPLHPNCRCRLQVFVVGVDSPDLPATLKREALRSVLRGWSLPSESNRVRVDAADRALRQAGNMPKSVQDYARRAVRTGEFPRTRAFPRHEVRAKALTPKRDTSARNEVIRKPVDPLKGLPRKRGDQATPHNPFLDDAYASMVTPGGGTGDGFRNADIRFTNPNYYEGREYQVNCQRVAVAYELRRRGYDVEARANVKSRDKQYTYHDLEAVWSERRAFTPIPGGPGGFHRAAEDIVRSWPNGSRGWVTANWKAGAAHIWNVEKTDDGRVIWLDAQIRQVLPEGEPHFRDAGSMQIMRVDDLTPTAEQAIDGEAVQDRLGAHRLHACDEHRAVAPRDEGDVPGGPLHHGGGLVPCRRTVGQRVRDDEPGGVGVALAPRLVGVAERHLHQAAGLLVGDLLAGLCHVTPLTVTRPWWRS
jgi:hypothetical protein